MKEKIPQKRFIMENTDSRYMLQRGFKRVRTRTETGKYISEFVKTIPIETWNGEPVLNLILRVDFGSREPCIDLRTINGYPYSPFYFDNGEVWDEYIDKIEHRVLDELKKYNIREKKKKSVYRVDNRKKGKDVRRVSRHNDGIEDRKSAV